MKKASKNEPDLFTNCTDEQEPAEETASGTADQLIEQRNEMIKKMSKELKSHDNQQ